MALRSRRLVVTFLWELCLLLTVICSRHTVQSNLELDPHPVINLEEKNDSPGGIHQRIKRQDAEMDGDLEKIPGVIASTFTNEIITKINGKDRVITETRVHYFFPEQVFTEEAANPINIEGATTSSSIRTYSTVQDGQTRFITSTFYTYFSANGGRNQVDVKETETLPGVITSSVISTYNRRRGKVTSTFYTYYFTQANGIGLDGNTFGAASNSEKNGGSESESGVDVIKNIPGVVASTFVSSFSTVAGGVTRFITETRLKYYFPETIEDEATEKINFDNAITSSVISTYTNVNAGRTRLFRSTFYTYYHTKAIVENGDYEYEDDESSDKISGNGNDHRIRHKESNGNGELSENNGPLVTSTFFNIVTKVINGRTRTVTQTQFMYFPSNKIEGAAADELNIKGPITSSLVSSFTRVVNGVTKRIRSTYFTFFFPEEMTEDANNGITTKPSVTKVEFPNAITSTLFTTYSTVINGKTRMVTETRLKYFIPDEIVTNFEKETEKRKNLITSTFFSTFTVTKNRRRMLVTSTFSEMYKQGSEIERIEEVEIEPTKSNEILASESMAGFLTSTVLSTFSSRIRGRFRTITKTKLIYYPATEIVTEKVNKPMTIPGAISSSQFSTYTHVENGRTKIIVSTFYTYYFNEATQTLLKPTTEVELENKITSTFYETYTKRIRGKNRLITSTVFSEYDYDYEDYNDEPKEKFITSTFYKTLIRRRGGKASTITSTILSVFEEEIQPTATMRNNLITSTAISRYTEIVSGNPTILTSRILTFYDEEGNEVEVEESSESVSQNKKSHIVKPTTRFNVQIITKAVGGEEILLTSSMESPLNTPVIAHRIRTSVPVDQTSRVFEEMEFPDDVEMTSSINPDENSLPKSSFVPEELLISKNTKIITSPITSMPIEITSQMPEESIMKVSENIEPSPTIEIPGVKLSTIYSTITKIKDGTTVINTIIRTKYFPVTVTVGKPINSEGIPRIRPTVEKPNYGTEQKSIKHLTSTIFSTYTTVVEGIEKTLTKTYLRHYFKSTKGMSKEESENIKNKNDEDIKNQSEATEDNQSQEESTEDANKAENKENNQKSQNGKYRKITSTFLKTYKTKYGGGKYKMVTSTIVSSYNSKNEPDDDNYYESDQEDMNNGKYTNNADSKNQSGGKYSDNKQIEYDSNYYYEDDNKSKQSTPSADTYEYDEVNNREPKDEKNTTSIKKYTKQNANQLQSFTSAYLSAEGEKEKVSYTSDLEEKNKIGNDYDVSNIEESKLTSYFVTTFSKVLGRRTHFFTTTLASVYFNSNTNDLDQTELNSHSHKDTNDYNPDNDADEFLLTKEITSTIAQRIQAKTRYVTSTFTSTYPIIDYYDDDITNLKKQAGNQNQGNKTFIYDNKKNIPSSVRKENMIRYSKEKIASTFLQTPPKIIPEKTKHKIQKNSLTGDNNENIYDKEENVNLLEQKLDVTSTFYTTFTTVRGSKTKLITQTNTVYYPSNQESGIGDGEIRDDDITSTLTKVLRYNRDGKTRTITQTFLSFYPKRHTEMLRMKPTEIIEKNLVTSTFFTIYPTVDEDLTQFVRQTKIVHYPLNGKPITQILGQNNTNDKFLQYVDAITSQIVKTHTKVLPGTTNYITSSWTSTYFQHSAEQNNEPSFISKTYKKPKHVNKKQVKSTYTKFYTHTSDYEDIDDSYDGPVTTIYGIPGAISSTFYHIFTTVRNGVTKYGTETKLVYFPTEGTFFNNKITAASTIVSTYDITVPENNEYITSTLIVPNGYEVTSRFFTTHTRIVGQKTLYFTNTRTEIYSVI